MRHLPILQGDDDENDVLLLQYAFNAAGIANPLVSVSDGQQVIDYLAGAREYADRERYPLPSLVLLDIKMPLRSGLDVLQWIRQQPSLRSLVVIMFTASASQQEVRRAYECGANSFVIKPTGTDRLTSLVRALHTFWIGYHQFCSVNEPSEL